MATTVARLQATLGADTSDYDRAMGRAESSTHKFGKAAKVAFLGVGAAVATGLGITAKRGWDEFNQGQKVAAQTNAVLKSTGGVARVTAKHVDQLGSSILKKSGIDDEAIKSGENMLLTFTKIRNETGKGNKVFDQATQALADLATSQNGGAIPSSEQMLKTAIRLGKALQDPIKGVSALRKVGVDLDEQQKKQIETFVKAGDIASAQKIILKELAVETGGSALAASKTLSGQITIINERFNNWAGGIVSKMIPALTDFVTWVADAAGNLQHFFGRVIHAPNLKLKFDIAAGGVKSLGVKVAKALQEAFLGSKETIAAGSSGFLTVFHDGLIQKIAQMDWTAIGKKIASGIIDGLTFTDAQLTKTFQRVLEWVNDHAQDFAEVGLVIALAMISTAFDPAFYLKHWQLVLSVAVLFFAKGFARVGSAAAEAFFERFMAGRIAGIAAAVVLRFSRLPENLQAVAIRAGRLVYEGFSAAIFPIEKALGRIPGWIQVAFKISALIAFYGALKVVAQKAIAVGEAISNSVLVAVRALHTALDKVVDAFKWLIDHAKAIGGIFGTISGAVGGLVGKVTGDVAPGVNAAVAAAKRPGYAVAGLQPETQGFLNLINKLYDDFVVTSGRRSPGENRRVGGASMSDHLTGRAFDLVPKDGWNDHSIALFDKIAAYAAISPIVRWIGWRGVPGHGPGNHLHISTFDQGGWLKPGLTLAQNNTGRPEPVGGGNITIPVSIGGEHVATVVFDMLRRKARVFENRNGRLAFGG